MNAITTDYQDKDRGDGREDRLRMLFDALVELPESEWGATLAREFPADAALHGEALALLEASRRARAEKFLEWPSEPSSPADPSRVGKFQVVRRLSDERSGQAVAFLAFDPDAQRHVAIKRYHDADDLDAAADEARALVRVSSPYVARCHGVERVGDEACLVVEYIPGRTLAEVRATTRPDPEWAARIVAQLAEGVAAVHARGLIHRDVKPANVILHDDGAPRLVDFGLAAHLGGDRLRGRSGSPPFMAPEQARREWDRIDYRTDVYGLGGVLYYLLTGRPPHEGDTSAEVLARASVGEIVPPRRSNPRVPRSLQSVCMKALEADPNRRHGSAAEFGEALRRHGRRRRWAQLAAAVSLTLLLAAAVFRGLRPSPPPPPPLDGRLIVHQFRRHDDPRRFVEIGRLGAESDNCRVNDDLKVEFDLGEPAYAYLIALNAEGGTELRSPADAAAVPQRLDRLVFPPVENAYYRLTDGAGYHVFVLVASREPLPPFAEWGLKLDDLPWKSFENEGVWVYDGLGLQPREAATEASRGQVVVQDVAPQPMLRVCEALRGRSGVDLVRAIGFPVRSPGGP